MEIVDGQLHANQFGPNWEAADLETTLTATIIAMDAVGVGAAIIDEYTGRDDKFNMLPGHYHSNGAYRPDRPFSRLAVETYPDRFAWISRVDPADSEMDAVVGGLRSQPGCVGIRVHAGFDGAVWRDERWLTGEYDALFTACQVHGVPVAVMAAPRLETLEPYIQRFPDLPFIIDHIGVTWPSADTAPTERYRRLDPVRRLADYPNTYLKWSHIERLAAEPYPYADALPHFRKVVDAYGAERVLWASDHTQAKKSGLSPHPAPYSHSLHYILDSNLFSTSEKQWLLGRTATTVHGLRAEVGHSTS